MEFDGKEYVLEARSLFGRTFVLRERDEATVDFSEEVPLAARVFMT